MLTGTVVNYYIHCRRQCWLFYHRLNMEDNSEDVRVGKILHELKRQGREEVALEGIKLDKLTAEYVTEFKKSDADLEAARAQLEFYLVTLQDKGIIRKGRLECLEKNKQGKTVHTVVLTTEEAEERKAFYHEIEEFLEGELPPPPLRKAMCKKCAYYAYCFV
ncbi:MAG TPA: CRISPR-associated protein Cas4 [Syntrophomonas wolfei]|jgi:CRISPR-associated exonuclease Cas4|uniref:CRISPR-associated protein Cas4 n=1 Tax=Syntrophomonas wolfei TaxID=863 RepID=A0A354YZ07_9FIRM|nr:CRISPR-associated protein Cas4 [Syntrophomonas wolfei]